MLFRDIQYYRYPHFNFSLVYATPYIRIFTFVTGIIVYDLFEIICKNNSMCVFVEKNSNKLEVFLLILNIFWWINANDIPLPVVAQEIINIILSGVTIIVFSREKGIISNFLLHQRWLEKFGHISMEFYLIHYLVINIGAKLIFSVIKQNNLILFCSIFVFGGISILLAVFLQKITERYFKITSI